MSDKKMYSVNQMVNLPDNILVSDIMYKMNSTHNIPKNIKETYYENRSSESLNKNARNDELDNLKVRQENILQKLQEIKEKLGNFKGDKKMHSLNNEHIPSTDINNLIFPGICEREGESSNILKKIENFKKLLLAAQDGQKEKNDKELEEWQHFILEQLLLLKAELKLISERNQLLPNFKHQGEDLKQKQNCIVKIIFALQTLLKSEICSWQDDVQENPNNISVEGYHAEILVLIARLRKEFECISKTLSDLEIKVETQDCNNQKSVPPSTKTDLKHGLQSFPILQNAEIRKGGVIKDFVICTNSSSSPYFLLAVKKILESGLRVFMSSSVHSSSSEVDADVLNHFQNNEYGERSSYDIAFTIIWKNQSAKSLMINPFSQCAIVGEGNILRYFGRFFSAFSSLNYEAGETVNRVSETDMWIDIIQAKLLHGSNKEIQNVLKQLNAKLGTSEWITGSNLGLCDIFLWSVILQLKISCGLPANISKWFSKINKMHGLYLGEANRDPNETEKVGGFVDRFGLEMFLKKNGIEFQSRDHEEVFTVDALLKYVKDMPGIHMKNLFLKDRKNQLYLLSARFDVQINLREIGIKIGVKDLRFADEAKLQEVLKVVRGCVTIYALLNDPGHKVKVLLDSEVVKKDRWKYVNFHPMVNSASLGISPQDLEKFLNLTGHEIHYLYF